MEAIFENQPFGKRLKSMLKVDFKRMFTMPLVYIMAAVGLVIPILILVMVGMMPSTSVDPVTGAETAVETFTNVWQIIGSVSSAETSMGLTGMCNINLLYFLAAVFVCIFVGEDFRSGYVKNLFAVRSKKTDYVISKTIVTFVGAAIMFVMFFIGAMIGGSIAGLSFNTSGFGGGGVTACLFSKIFMIAIFVAIGLTISVVAKQKLWLSILGSFAAGMLLFTMLSIMAPLNATFLNVVMCLAGGILFAIGLGAVSNIILKKTNLV